MSIDDLDHDFDAIVIGAGAAGLCCAGELVLRGLRPLLICETKEVGWTLRSRWVGKNRGVCQHPVWQPAGEVSWYQLVRALNIPVRISPLHYPLEITIHGSGVFHDVDYCSSAAALGELFARVFAGSPLPMAQIQGPFEKIAQIGLAIPYPELRKLHRVSMAEWLAEQGADEMLTQIMLALASVVGELPLEAGTEMSVFGFWALIRSLVCGEQPYMLVYPDAQEGLCVPLARAIERGGGVVSRGHKVQCVPTEQGKVGTVVLEDGTEFWAPVVAIATGNSRIPALLDAVPAQVEEALTYAAKFSNTTDVVTYTLLDKPVVPPARDRFTAVLNPDDLTRPFLQYSWPLHSIVPWCTEPGKQFLLSQRLYTSDAEVAAAGSRDDIVAAIHALNEDLYPGYNDAIEDVGVLSHRHHWSAPFLAGPKLPRTVADVDGLWFVGDGSTPIDGVYFEAAASAGILGARSIVESLQHAAAR
jgi:phytoene dehydrogenase-like protein